MVIACGRKRLYDWCVCFIFVARMDGQEYDIVRRRMKLFPRWDSPLLRSTSYPCFSWKYIYYTHIYMEGNLGGSLRFRLLMSLLYSETRHSLFQLSIHTSS